MTIDDLKLFFETAVVPEGYQLYPGTIISDPKVFLESQFILLDRHKGDINNCPAWWRLTDLYTQMKG